MAANDYYSSYNNPPQDHAFSPPTNNAGYDKPAHASDVSPLASHASPFDDRLYGYNQRPGLSQQTPSYPATDSSYHGAAATPYSNSQYNNSTDPFADQNAIPLQPSSSQQPLTAKSNGMKIVDMEGQKRPRKPRQRRKKEGWFTGKITYVCFTLTLVQIGVFVGELIKNATLTGSPIMVKPSFNFMIGPSPWVLINMGSRYTPCMHNIRDLTDWPQDVMFPCPNSTNFMDTQCTLSQVCGFGGFPDQPHPTPFDDRSDEPNQWWRFIVPIFLHVGLIHIGFNMLLQMTLGRDMEKQVGSIRFALVYFSSGIFGFVLGGNYAPPLVSSVGASGALFGVIGLVALDILYTWRDRPSPMKDLLFLMIDIIIMIVLGFLPGLDNFSHIGGLLMGLILGVCILHSPNILRARTGVDEPPYAVVGRDGQEETTAFKAFIRQPLGFFKGRKPAWWAWWLVRAGALVAALIGFILLLQNFYDFRNECEWCHKLCIPIKDWCDQGEFEWTKNRTTKRDVFDRELFDFRSDFMVHA